MGSSQNPGRPHDQIEDCTRRTTLADYSKLVAFAGNRKENEGSGQRNKSQCRNSCPRGIVSPTNASFRPTPYHLSRVTLINPLQLRRVKRLVLHGSSPAILNREARGFQPRRNFLLAVRIRRRTHVLPLHYTRARSHKHEKFAQVLQVILRK